MGKLGGYQGDPTLPQCASPWKRRARTQAVCNCQSGYDLQLRAYSQQMVAEIKFVKQGRHNGAATTQGGRRSTGCVGVQGSVKSESDVWRLKELQHEPARLRVKHPPLHMLPFFSPFPFSDGERRRAT